MELLIGITHNNHVRAVVYGEWRDKGAWIMNKVSLKRFYMPSYDFDLLKEAIFENRYGAIIHGGIVPSSVEHHWEGIKGAVDEFCKDRDYEWGLYEKDPEYVVKLPPGAVQ